MILLEIYKPIRKYSYPLIAVSVVGLLAYFFLLKSDSAIGMLIVAGVSLLFILMWFWLRPGKSKISAAEEVFKAIGNGRPTFLNVYSNY